MVVDDPVAVPAGLEPSPRPVEVGGVDERGDAHEKRVDGAAVRLEPRLGEEAHGGGTIADRRVECGGRELAAARLLVRDRQGADRGAQGMHRCQVGVGRGTTYAGLDGEPALELSGRPQQLGPGLGVCRIAEPADELEGARRLAAGRPAPVRNRQATRVLEITVTMHASRITLPSLDFCRSTMGAGLRQLLFPIRLARSRLGAGGERLFLVAVGIVAGAAAIAAVLSGRLVMQDRSLAQATAALPASDRSVEVAWFGALSGNWASLDRRVAPALQELTGRAPTRAMLYRESQIDGRLVTLRAANDLAQYVHLRSGRLPRSCVPTHCEVLRLKGVGPVPSKPTIRLVQVGTATLDADAPFAPYIAPETTAVVSSAIRYHTPQPSPVLIANGVDGMSRMPELSSFFRSYAWFVPVEAGDVHPWSIGSYTHGIETLRSQLGEVSDQFEVTAPTDELTAAVASSQVAARRLLLLGGETGALLLAFTVLAAGALRREAADARRRLLWAGARRWQVELHTFTETGAVALLGTLAGWAVGAGVGAIVASAAGSPAGAVVEHALLSGTGLATVAIVAVASSLLLFLTVRAPGVQVGRLALTPLDVAALAAVGAVLVGYARGSVDTASLATSGGTGTFVLLVPALVTFTASVAAARLLVPTLRLVGRIGRRGSVALRLAALSLSRNPGGATVTATFLVASLGLALFASTYRATLLQGQRDEAAYAEPAPYVVDEDLAQLIPVLHGWNGGPVTQVIRLSGDVPSAATFTFLGVDAQHLTTTGGWRSDFASSSLATLGAAIQPTTPVTAVTTALPAGSEFELPASVHGTDIGLRAYFRSPLGDYDSVDLGLTDGPKGTVLRGKLPFAGARLASLQFEFAPSGRSRGIANAGTGIQPAARGVVTLGTPTVGGKAVHDAFADWIGTSGARRTAAAAVTIAYSLTADETARFRPEQPTDGVPLQVLVTPDVAASADTSGDLTLELEGENVPVHVAGVIRRFPSIVGGAVVADRTAAETTLDTLYPGLGTTTELWANTLPAHPPDVLQITSRATVLAQLKADPLARGALLTLAATAALALALAGLLLGVVGDRRDDRGELFDLEAQGVAPATIRLHLRLRALLVALFGLVGGVIAGAVLSALVLSLVSVTASAAKPEPPLRLELEPGVLGIAIVVYALIAAGLVVAATQLRGQALDRAAEAAV